MQQSETTEDIPARPAHIPSNWRFCQCGIRCKPSKWVAQTTWYSHQELVRERDQAVQQQRPAMAYSLGLRNEVNKQKRVSKKRREVLLTRSRREASVQPAASGSHTQTHPSDEEEQEEDGDDMQMQMVSFLQPVVVVSMY